MMKGIMASLTGEKKYVINLYFSRDGTKWLSLYFQSIWQASHSSSFSPKANTSKKQISISLNKENKMRNFILTLPHCL
jgi:hypothetical protein